MSGSPRATGWSWPAPGRGGSLPWRWQPVTWTQADRMKGQARGLKTIESFHTDGPPPVER